MKYLFFDIDGTLIGKSRKLRQETIDALKQARTNGHKVIICTGRSPTMVSKDIYDLEYDALICSAGSYIYIDDQLVYEHYIDESVLKRVRDLFSKNGITFSLETEKAVYETKENGLFFKTYELARRAYDYELLRFKESHSSTDLRNRRSINEYHDDIHVAKIDFISFGKKILNIKDELETYFDIVYFREYPQFINGELITKDCTKADGVRKVVEYFNGSMEDTIAFGDTMNDYPMLEISNIGVCFESSPDDLKKVCQYTFREPDRSGVVEVMRKMGLI